MVSHLLDWAFLRKTLLQLLLQFLPGAQGLLDAEEVRKLLQACVGKVFSKMIHALPVNRKQLLKDKRKKTVTQKTIQMSASIMDKIFILKQRLEYLTFGTQEQRTTVERINLGSIS